MILYYAILVTYNKVVGNGYFMDYASIASI